MFIIPGTCRVCSFADMSTVEERHAFQLVFASLITELSPVQVIAEPGRYFAESCCSFACMVFGMRSQKLLDGEQGYDYWITDGLYGSMNSLMYDHAVLTARPLVNRLLTQDAMPGHEAGVDSRQLYRSTVFGPTCDGLDTVLSDYKLPKLSNGDWLVFPNMGAYALAGASKFNGINSTDIKMCYVWSQRSV